MISQVWTDEEKLKLYNLVAEQGQKWSTFAQIFSCSPNAIRNLYRRTDWISFIEKVGVKKILSPTTPIKEKEEVSVEKMIEDKKKQIESEVELKKIKEQINTFANKDLITDKILSAISKIQNISPKEIIVPKPKTKLSPQESVLLISDAHIGLAVLEEEVGGCGKYNVNVFKNRLNNLVKTVCDITELHRTQHPLDTINVIFLGDIVHGSNDVGKWGFVHTEQNIIDQVFEACRQFSIALLTLKQVYKNVKVCGVMGNHGRVGQRGMEKLFVNWDYIIYKWIESSLSLQEGFTFDFPKSPFHIINVFNKKLLVSHGDNVKSWLGIPFYGLNRKEAQYKGLFERQKTLEKAWQSLEDNKIDLTNPGEVAKHVFQYQKTFDMLICGHFHTNGEVETPSGGRIIINPSFIGGDDYSINQLTASGTPSQKFFGINHDRATWKYDIDLDK